ncbi:unnamed protein product [Strongylus vulgaris]|uniref:Uncharacterized protein n=1 Tax=Strongylus vulgaris TaxID=40348 RepID=A0A3P7JY00_STRVU|nr:unnamed protein product [Strongylus vulgaris]
METANPKILTPPPVTNLTGAHESGETSGSGDCQSYGECDEQQPQCSGQQNNEQEEKSTAEGSAADVLDVRAAAQAKKKPGLRLSVQLLFKFILNVAFKR